MAEEKQPDKTNREWVDKVKVTGSLFEYFIRQENVYFNGRNTDTLLESSLRLGAVTKFTEGFTLNLGVYGEQVAGDAKHYTMPKDHRWNVEAEYLNFALDKLFGLPLSFIAGRQNISFGDGFLIDDFFYDHRAIYVGTMKSLRALRLTYAPSESLKVDTFAGWVDKHYKSYEAYLKDLIAYCGKRNIFGANFNYRGKKSDVWDTGIFYKNDRSQLHSSTYAFSLRGAMPLPFLPELSVEAEAVSEWGRTKIREGALSPTKQERRSFGGHLDAIYNFKDNPYSPYIRAGYRYFPGDDPKTSRNEAFDPFFYGAVDSGKWYLGALNGFNLFNTNERAWVIDTGFNPSKTTKLRLQYFDIRLDRENNEFGGKPFSREWDVILDWYPKENFFTGVRFDYAHPLKAARAFSGCDDNTIEVAAWVGVNF